ncbi:hypothetical protein, partial [Escherichia coli]
MKGCATALTDLIVIPNVSCMVFNKKMFVLIII